AVDACEAGALAQVLLEGSDRVRVAGGEDHNTAIRLVSHKAAKSEAGSLSPRPRSKPHALNASNYPDRQTQIIGVRHLIDVCKPMSPTRSNEINRHRNFKWP